MATHIVQLLDGNGTLYSEKPSVVAGYIEEKLNQLEASAQEIVAVASLPDYHNFGSDGGTKDILFVCRDAKKMAQEWHATTIIHDHDTMHGWETERIVQRVSEAISDLEGQGFLIAHIVPITDHHESASFSGVGGYDGTKNIILCYYPAG